MKRWFFLFVFLGVAPLALADLTAAEVVQNQVNSNTGYGAEEADGKMVIYGESGSQVEREFKMMQLEEKGVSTYKAMIKVLQPSDLKGTGLLTYQNKDREDDQWLFLPAMGKTRRISGAARGGKFLGSDFNYEDLAPKEKNDFTYQTLRTEPCENTNCYVLEAKPKDAESLYSKSIHWIRQDNFAAIKTEMYDKSGQLEKTVTYAEYQLFNNKFWRPLRVTMQDVQKHRRTELVFSNVAVGTSLSDADFSKQSLER